MIWNLLFGLAQAAFSALAVLVVFLIIPERAWKLLPAEVLSWRNTVARFVVALTFVIVFASSLATYGPRYELNSHRLQPSIERVEVESGEAWSNTEDRLGNADHRREA